MRRKCRLICVLLLIHVQFFAQWSLAVSSRVERDGKGLGGANISLIQGGKTLLVQKSDAGGNFTVRIPPDGDFMLEVSYPECKTKKFQFVTYGVPPEMAEEKFNPTFEIGGVSMRVPLPGIDYSALSRPLIRVVFFKSNEKFDHEDQYTESMLGALGKIRSDEQDLLNRHAGFIKTADAALKKGDCPLAKENYEIAVNLIPVAPYHDLPKSQLEKCNTCIAEKAKELEEKKKADELAAQKKAEAEKLKAEQERLAKEKAEKEKVAAAEAAAKQKAEQAAADLAAKQKLEQDRLAKEKAEQDKVAAAESLAKQKAEEARLAADKKAADQAAADLAAKQKAEQDRLAKEKAEQDKVAAAESSAKQKAEEARLAAEKKAADQAAADLAAKQKAEQDRLAKEKAEQDKVAAAESSAKQKAEEARVAAEKKAADQAAADLAAKQKAEQDRLAKEKVEKEKALAKKEIKQGLLVEKKSEMPTKKDEIVKTETLVSPATSALPENKIIKATSIEDGERQDIGSSKPKHSIPQAFGADRYKDLVKRGDEYIKMKRYDEAKSVFDEALLIKPKDPYVLQRLALIAKAQELPAK